MVICWHKVVVWIWKYIQVHEYGSTWIIHVHVHVREVFKYMNLEVYENANANNVDFYVSAISVLSDSDRVTIRGLKIASTTQVTSRLPTSFKENNSKRFIPCHTFFARTPYRRDKLSMLQFTLLMLAYQWIPTIGFINAFYLRVLIPSLW